MSRRSQVGRVLREWCVREDPDILKHIDETDEEYYEIEIGKEIVFLGRENGEDRTWMQIDELFDGDLIKKIRERLGGSYRDFLLLEVAKLPRVELAVDEDMWYLNDYLYDDTFSTDTLFQVIRNLISSARQVRASLKRMSAIVDGQFYTKDDLYMLIERNA